ncbi:unnamed protein product [Caenorhabditis sp. 36 PRJEB53466]|nr:unnamed protein product [Caenorhabditis sp. 36 PRJEB53466]
MSNSLFKRFEHKTPRYFGRNHRRESMGLLSTPRDYHEYKLLRAQNNQKELCDMDLWLLCHPDNEAARALYRTMISAAERTAPQVSHDEIVSWLATAIRCHPAMLVPRGEGFHIEENRTVPVDARGVEWTWAVGVQQARYLLEYLSKCTFQRLSVDERANILFALLRIFSDRDQGRSVSECRSAEPLFRRLHPSECRVATIEALAAVFFQIANDVATMADAIRCVWRLLDDEPLVMRLTCEILMCLCQRSEVAATLPDFAMGDRIYCKQVKVIILDLTSDAHEQVPDVEEKNILSDLVNELFHLEKKASEEAAAASVAPTSSSTDSGGAEADEEPLPDSEDD